MDINFRNSELENFYSESEFRPKTWHWKHDIDIYIANLQDHVVRLVNQKQGISMASFFINKKFEILFGQTRNPKVMLGTCITCEFTN